MIIIICEQGRGPVRCVKRIRGRRGKPDTIEYLVNIELVRAGGGELW